MEKNNFPPLASNNPSSKFSLLTLILALLIGSLIGGAAVSSYKDSQYLAQQNSLQSQINSLKIQISSLSPSLASSASPSPSPRVSCQDSLKAVLSNGTGTAGTYYYRLTLTNTGNTPCAVSNQPPVVTALDLNNNSLGQVTTPFDTQKVTTLTLAPGDKVYNSIGFPNSGAFTNPSDCKPLKSLKLDLNANDLHFTLTNVDTLNPGHTDSFCKNDLKINSFSLTPF